MPIETEVKFFIDTLPPIRQALLAIGARSQGRHFEVNHRLEDDSRSLRPKGCLLRLRRDRRVTLTFKSRPAQGSTEFKVADELEVEVSDFETMGLILGKLGFSAVQSYEKWRETLILEGVCCCLDEMPYGAFLEIEGEPRAIRPLSARLGLAWERRIRINYLQIFEILRQQLSLPFTDLTFAHFREHPDPLPPFLHLVEEGLARQDDPSRPSPN